MHDDHINIATFPKHMLDDAIALIQLWRDNQLSEAASKEFNTTHSQVHLTRGEGRALLENSDGQALIFDYNEYQTDPKTAKLYLIYHCGGRGCDHSGLDEEFLAADGTPVDKWDRGETVQDMLLCSRCVEEVRSDPQGFLDDNETYSEEDFGDWYKE